jgi:hypothetical protein
MKKYFLGAGAALALLSAPLFAQTGTQKPAPIVPASDMPAFGEANAPMGSVEQAGAFDVLSRVPGMNFTPGNAGYAPARVYTEASYLLSFVSDAQFAGPTLTGGTNGGILGRPGTTTLAGEEKTSYGTLSGFKVGIGGLIGATSVGFETNVMVFGNVNDRVTFGPTSAALLTRPFYDTVAKRENAIAIAAPGAFTGGFDQTTTLSAWGFEANPFFRLVQGSSVNFDIITGFRNFNVNEKLDIYDSRRLQTGGVSAFNGIGIGNGAQLVVHDKYSTRNNFYGLNLGGRLSYSNGPWFIDATAKVAIGGVHQVLNIDGTTTLVSGGGLVSTTTAPGGLLASPGVNGDHTENRFAVLPEGNIQLGYQLTSWANVFAGYQVMYVSSVARPTEQINRNLNPNNIPTVSTFTTRGIGVQNVDVKETDIFLHGFNFGFTILY